MGFIFYFLPKLLLALQPFLPFPLYRGFFLFPFSSPLMPLSATLSPPLPLPAGKQGRVVPPALSCIPSCWLHGKPHAQKCTPGPAMRCCSCPGSSWDLEGTVCLWATKGLRAKGEIISSLGILANFGSSIAACFVIFWFIVWCDAGGSVT